VSETPVDYGSRTLPHDDVAEQSVLGGMMLSKDAIADVVETLRNRPGTQHVVMTGRDADPKLIEVADLVTEMTKIKHPMDVGRKGQKGIEW